MVQGSWMPRFEWGTDGRQKGSIDYQILIFISLGLQSIDLFMKILRIDTILAVGLGMG